MTDQELNELVARKLGWREDVPHSSPVGDRYIPYPAYSSDIKAAWEIINQFHEITVGTKLAEDNYWFCELRPQGKEPVTGHAVTAPRAICEAFLKLP